jgi:hypothetical protein
MERRTLRENLDDQVAPKLGITGAIQLAHATGAYEREYLVSAHRTSGDDRRVLSHY